MSEDITIVRRHSACGIRREKNRIIRTLMLSAFPDTPEGECHSQLQWNCMKALKKCNLTDLIHALTWWQSGAPIKDITTCLTYVTDNEPA